MNIPAHLLTDEQVKANLAFEDVYHDIRKFRSPQEAAIWSLRYKRVVLDGDDGMFWSVPLYSAVKLFEQGYCLNELTKPIYWKDGYTWPGWRNASPR